jgi:hypothetical protein
MKVLLTEEGVEVILFVVFYHEMLENINIIYLQEANKWRLLGRYVRASYSAGFG